MKNKDRIMNRIYRKFFKERQTLKFGRINKILHQMSYQEIDLSYLIAILTVLCPCKDKIKMYDTFFNRVDIRCTQCNVDPDEVLQGLE